MGFIYKNKKLICRTSVRRITKPKTTINERIVNSIPKARVRLVR